MGATNTDDGNDGGEMIGVMDAVSPGSDSSEFAQTRAAQYIGSGLFVSVLGIVVAKGDLLPTSIAVTALICAAVITAWPTVHYTMARSSVKRGAIAAWPRMMVGNDKQKTDDASTR